MQHYKLNTSENLHYSTQSLLKDGLRWKENLKGKKNHYDEHDVRVTELNDESLQPFTHLVSLFSNRNISERVCNHVDNWMTSIQQRNLFNSLPCGCYINMDLTIVRDIELWLGMTFVCALVGFVFLISVDQSWSYSSHLHQFNYRYFTSSVLRNACIHQRMFLKYGVCTFNGTPLFTLSHCYYCYQIR